MTDQGPHDDSGSTPITTVGLLIYPRRPKLNFARLVADLDAALGGLAVETRELRWDHDDLAVLDVGSSRIALAIAEGPHAGGVTIAVATGLGPSQGGDTRLAERRQAVSRLIADRIAARFVPERIEWRECDAVATADLLDKLCDDIALPETVPTPAEVERRAALAARVARARVAARLGAQADLPRLLDRVEATLAARKAGLADPLVAANDSPDLPRLYFSGLESVRTALYSGPDDYEAPPSRAIRLAAHSIDATMMVVALPVGAAMMTYGLMRGGDLHASARMLALCGIGIGALQSIGGLPGLAALVPHSI